MYILCEFGVMAVAFFVLMFTNLLPCFTGNNAKAD